MTKYDDIVNAINQIRPDLPTHYPDNHDNLINCMQTFGYQIDDEGVCNGYVNAGIMLQSLSKQPQQFYDFLALINLIQPDFLRAAENELKQTILKEARQKTLASFSQQLNRPITDFEMLSKEEQNAYSRLLEKHIQTSIDALAPIGQALYHLGGFFDMIAFSHDPEQFQEMQLYISPLHRQHEGYTLSTIATIALDERGGVEVIKQEESTEFVFTNQEFKRFLNILDAKLKAQADLTEPIAIKLDTARHMSAISFDPATQKWSRVGTNLETSESNSYTIGEVFTELYLEHGLVKDKRPIFPYVKIDFTFFPYKSEITKLDAVLKDTMIQAFEEKLLIYTKEKINFAFDIQDQSVLFSATQHGDAAKVQAFMSLGADINKTKTILEAPLSSPKLDNPVSAADKGVTYNKANFITPPFIVTALDEAILTKNNDVLTTLLEGRPNEFTMLSAVKHAVAMDHPEAVEMILNSPHPLDVNDRSILKGTTFLHLAVCESPSSIPSLLAYGAEIDETDLYLNTPLHLAVNLGKLDAVRTLLEYHADPTASNGDRKTPLQIAAEKGDDHIMQLLIDHGADLTTLTSTNTSAEHTSKPTSSTAMMFQQLDTQPRVTHQWTAAVPRAWGVHETPAPTTTPSSAPAASAGQASTEPAPEEKSSPSASYNPRRSR